ncbi:phytoene desaturase [Sphingobacteriales bacterium UPWRP_1]|nr:phytoene desaturase [Sphingobacteriales bacterium TSM_CSS]PSJ77535.1 phytoene desaturase [Sphingobacteriales bacterium UPWRP_1]
MSKKALIIGTGLGGLATALRLTAHGYQVEMVEKYHQPGGRLNQLKKDGFTFDVGPSFFSMSYEFEELFHYCNIPNPLQLHELNPVYSVYFANRNKPFLIYKDLQKLAGEFKDIEPDFEEKVRHYLARAKSVFHDTEYRIIKKNFNGLLSYALGLMSVPLKHSPMLFRTMWQELERNFSSQEVKVIFSLVAFFLGSTPFDTPAVYSLLNYTELEHDGYWSVKGGMYRITETLTQLLQERGVTMHFNTEIVESVEKDGKLAGFIDQNGNKWQADVYVSNSDAAFFRGKVLKRAKFSEQKLDNMKWTLAPFTIYLGVKGNIPDLYHHNYFLGNNFKEYADTIFKTSVSPQKPYYYVNVSSKTTPECAPEGCENIFILCPVPDLRFKPDWSDSEQLADNIIADMSARIGYDLQANTISRTIYNPIDWRDKFNLYKGSGLGLAHGLDQVAGLRPNNADENYNNLFYVGASTVPGTGLPIVLISSKLVTERIVGTKTTQALSSGLPLAPHMENTLS